MRTAQVPRPIAYLMGLSGLTYLAQGWSLAKLRKTWNARKSEVAPWWEANSKEAYNADAYAYLKKEEVVLQPGVPWVFETTLEDPQWGILTASTGVHAMQGSPNPRCEIAIDGQVVTQNSGPYTAHCQLGQW